MTPDSSDCPASPPVSAPVTHEACSPIWVHRIRPLVSVPEIAGYAATIDLAALGRGFEVLLQAEIATKDLATVEAFEARVSAMDEVVELRRMFGLPDYLIRVRTADADAFERWLTTRLLGDPAVARVDSRITMKLIKSLH